MLLLFYHYEIISIATHSSGTGQSAHTATVWQLCEQVEFASSVPNLLAKRFKGPKIRGILVRKKTHIMRIAEA